VIKTIRANPRKSAAIALALPLVAGFEGLRQKAYQDFSPARVWTVCYGETDGVQRGDTYSKAECDEMLAGRLEDFERGVRACVTAPLTPAQMAASISLAYNIGTGAFCKSSVARNFNAGNVRAACDSFLKFNRAGGIVFPGLTRRREAERQLCLRS
jgi:lysozyme